MTDAKAVRALMADGIATAVGHDGDIPLKWVVVIETLDEQGKRCLWRISAEDMAQWDAIALHEYALVKIKADLTRSGRD